MDVIYIRLRYIISLNMVDRHGTTSARVFPARAGASDVIAVARESNGHRTDGD